MSRERRRLIAAFVAVPVAAAVLTAAWRVGSGWREVVRAADLDLAERVAAAWEPYLRRGGEPLDGFVAAVEDPSVIVYEHAVYARAPDGLRRDAGAAALPRSLPSATVERLLAVDRPFNLTVDGRSASLVPVRDEDGWAVQGAVLVARRSALPPPVPPTVLGWGVLAWVLSVAAAWWYGRPLPRGDPAGARSVADRAALRVAAPAVLAPVLGYAAYTTAEGGGLGALIALGLAAAVAGVGLTLLRIADRGLRLRQALHGWAFLAPSLLHLLLFSIGPIAFCLYLSFHEWNLVEPARPFVGLDNYGALLADADFGRALLNTAFYVLFVPVGMTVALGLALLVNRPFRGVRLLRTVLFLPYVTSFVAISLVWKWMYEPEFGLFNNILGQLGLPEGTWLSAPATAMPSLMLMSVWMFAGYMMVIFLAGLQNIPDSLYESARIDGADAWQRFRHITLPMLRPTTFFILVTMVIFMFQVFTAVYVMTEGGPLHATDVIVYHIYRNAWEYLRMGYASAMAWVLFAIVFVITLAQWRWLGGRVRS